MAVLIAPERIRKPDHHHENAEGKPQELRPHQVHGQTGNQVVFVNRHPDRVGNDHHASSAARPVNTKL